MMLFEVLHTAHRGQRWTGHAMTHQLRNGSCDLAFTVTMSMHKLHGYNWATKNNAEGIYYAYLPSQNYFFTRSKDPQLYILHDL